MNGLKETERVERVGGKRYGCVRENSQPIPSGNTSPILITICSTGIRISELEYLTADAVKKGRMTVFNKGKHRVVIIPDNLRKNLRLYMIQMNLKYFRTICGISLQDSSIHSTGI